MPTSVDIKNLKINKLTEAQYNAAVQGGVIGENELSLITDLSDTIQVATMPTASSSKEGQIVQYVGATDSTYTNGYFYKCTTDGSTYVWEQINVQPGDLSNKVDKITTANKLYGTNGNGDQVGYNVSSFAAAADLDPLVIQWPVLPEPTASLEGVVYEYVGETNSTYTNGYFYKCVGTSATVEAVSLLPAASAQEAGKIYRYVGETNSIYTKNNCYKCTSDGLIADDWSNTEYEKFSWKEVITDTSGISTVSELPAASAQEFGNVYKQGNKYYKCTSYLMAAGWGEPDVTVYKWSELETLNLSDSTYAWEQLNVQPGGSSLPSQTGQSGKFLTTDGTDASWAAIPSEIDDNSTSATATWSASKINSMIGNVESLLAAI